MYKRQVKRNIAPEGISYNEMNVLASKAPIGSAGISILPFGNGAERMLNNKDNPAEIQMQRRLDGFMSYIAEEYNLSLIHIFLTGLKKIILIKGRTIFSSIIIRID